MSGIDPSSWGPLLWDILHWITFNYTEMNAQLMQIFLVNVPNLLACKKCKENYLEHIHTFPPDFRSKDKFSRWFVKIHNQTNKTLGKKIVNYSKVKPRYTRETSSQRVKQSFLKWNQIVRNYMNNSPVEIQRSYSDFLSFIFSKIFLID